MDNKTNKMKALEAALSQIEKQYGKGSVMKLGDKSANMQIETVPSRIVKVWIYAVWELWW